jgi:hypothetical protein
MQQTDVWIGTLHNFTIELQHQTQHTVCGRMLGAKGHCVILDL